MSRPKTVIRDIAHNVMTFSTRFNRFAPFGYRNFITVGNRSTAIRLQDERVLVLNPIQLEPNVQAALTALGGVHFIAADLGHHMYVTDYLRIWPNAKTVGVLGLVEKRKDIRWDFIYAGKDRKPEDEYDFSQEIATILFEGFITYAVAWYHKPTKTLIQSDLLMNLPCTEQYNPSSSAHGVGSKAFAKRANPWSIWFKLLIYYIASVDYALMRRDAKRVADWDKQRIVPCHGDIIEAEGNEAWESVYEWFLFGSAYPGLMRRVRDRFMKVMQWWFLM